MDADRWRRIKDLAHAATSRRGRERAGFLDEACAGDVALRREVDALLARESEAEGFLTTPAWSTPALVPGTGLGPYEIVDLIGAGGMGEVYKARDTRLDRTVAIKIVSPELGADPDPSTSSGSSRERVRDERRQRFEREAKTISQLNHPHICTLYDVGEAEVPSRDRKVGAGFSRPARVSYLVMEYLEGETLAERLRRGALPLGQALDYGVQIADALAAAHKQGVIHRDLKPGNVMLTKSGAKLLDFGLAKLRGHGDQPVGDTLVSAQTQSGSLTGQGTIVGTLQYMAPEQLEGKSVDARTDLFALGTIVYEMVTGRRAFEGENAASLIGAILERDPTPLRENQPLTPPALDRLVGKSLAKAPENRWDTAHDVADELSWIRETSGVAEAAGVHRAGGRWSPGALVVTGVLLGTIVGAGVTSFWWSSAPAFTLTYPSLDVGPAEELNAGGAYSQIYIPGGTRTALTWAPDGQALVFVGRKDGVKRLYVRRLDEAVARPLAGTDGAQVPAVSADGQWIAFWAGRMLKKVPTTGGPVTDLASDIILPPKGLVWGDRGSLFFGSPDGIRELTSDGMVRTVTTVGDADVEHVLPWPLPSQRALLYTVRKDSWSWGDDQVVALILATGEQKVILTDAVDARYVPPNHLVFMRRGQILVANFDATRIEARGQPVVLLDHVAQALTAFNTEDVTGAGQFAIAGPSMLAWLPGALPRYAAGMLVTVDLEGRVAPLPAPERSYGPAVRLSPDGRRLVVTTQTISESGRWVYDLGRTTLTPLPGGGETTWAVWSPDGHRLVFDWLEGGRRALAAQPADGTAPPEVLIRGPLVPSSWLRAGAQLATTRDVPRLQIDVVTFQSGDATVTPLLESPDNDGWPELSPDGRWLAYSSDVSGRYEVYVRPYPGPGPAELISLDGGSSPAWHPSGRGLFYLGRRDQAGKGQLLTVEFNPESSTRIGVPHSLFKFNDDELYFGCGPVRCYDVGPDGQRFYTVRLKSRPTQPVVTHINLIQNWFEELKAKVPTGR